MATAIEHGCDECGVTVENGSGCYRGDDRLCEDCYQRKDGEVMATRIKVTLDTDQWARIYFLLGDRIKKDDWLGRKSGKEVYDAIMLAARGTGEGEPCGCEEWAE